MVLYGKHCLAQVSPNFEFVMIIEYQGREHNIGNLPFGSYVSVVSSDCTVTLCRASDIFPGDTNRVVAMFSVVGVTK